MLSILSKSKGMTKSVEAANSEVGADHETKPFGGGGGDAAAAAAAAIRQSGPVDSTLPEESTADGNFY